MIRKVKVEYLKMFKRQEFELNDHVVLAGPNNSGKSTLLQAIMIWGLALQQWVARRGPGSGSKAKERTGIPLTREDFTVLPLREMSLLWTDTQTGLRKDELKEGQKPGQPRVLLITLEGIDKHRIPWELGFEFRYSTTKMVYCKPVIEIDEEIPAGAFDTSIVHVPPFSGIGSEETRMDRPYQDLLVGQGKAGDILRNLLLEVYQNNLWEELCSSIREAFGYQLIEPKYEGRPFIQCDYLKGIPDGKGKDGLPQLDIANAGSGFHQVLLMLSFFYARPATVLLLDEPDAHLHIILQKQVYQTLQAIAYKRKCQMILATHSEVFLESTSPDKILSFYGRPHLLLSDMERDQVREAIKRLPATDLLAAELSPSLLYVEGETDFDLLREWALVLGHPLCRWFKRPFWHSNQGRHPREARGHFFALKALKPDTKGILLLDGDNRNLEDREIGADGLTILRWKRYEAESYLCHPQALERFLDTQTEPLFAEPAKKYLRDQLPPALFREPLLDYDFFVSTPVSKTILPEFFKKAGLPIDKREYYLVARQMRSEEIFSEVKEKLDQIIGIMGI